MKYPGPALCCTKRQVTSAVRDDPKGVAPLIGSCVTPRSPFVLVSCTHVISPCRTWARQIQPWGSRQKIGRFGPIEAPLQYPYLTESLSENVCTISLSCFCSH